MEASITKVSPDHQYCKEQLKRVYCLRPVGAAMFHVMRRLRKRASCTFASTNKPKKRLSDLVGQIGRNRISDLVILLRARAAEEVVIGKGLQARGFANLTDILQRHECLLSSRSQKPSTTIKVLKGVFE